MKTDNKKTIVLFGNAAWMTPEIANKYRAGVTIAVNRAVQHAPWADMLVSIDGNSGADTFDGTRLNAVDIPHERVVMSALETLEIRNNTIAAVRIAARQAQEISLVGFDLAAYEEKHAYRGLCEAMAALQTELMGVGITLRILTPQEAI